MNHLKLFLTLTSALTLGVAYAAPNDQPSPITLHSADDLRVALLEESLSSSAPFWVAFEIGGGSSKILTRFYSRDSGIVAELDAESTNHPELAFAIRNHLSAGNFLTPKQLESLRIMVPIVGPPLQAPVSDPNDWMDSDTSMYGASASGTFTLLVNPTSGLFEWHAKLDIKNLYYPNILGPDDFGSLPPSGPYNVTVTLMREILPDDLDSSGERRPWSITLDPVGDGVLYPDGVIESGMGRFALEPSDGLDGPCIHDIRFTFNGEGTGESAIKMGDVPDAILDFK